MRILITGVPGTGKTSVSKRLSEIIKLPVYHINELVMKKKLYKEYDKERESYVVDLNKLCKELEKIKNGIIEGHLAHFCVKDGDIVIVLRTKPLILKKRLKKKGYGIKKIEENIEAEMIDLISQEVAQMGNEKDIEMYEIDTSDKGIDRVAVIIKKILEDKRYARHFVLGWVDFTSEILDGKL